MGMVYHQPSSHNSNYNRGDDRRHNYNKPQDRSGIAARKLVLGILRTAAVGVAIVAVVFFALTLYTAAISLTWPALLRALPEPTSLSPATCVTLVLEGCVAGLVVGLIRKVHGLRSKLAQTTLSKTISHGVLARDATFAPTLILSILVAAAVGAIASASGTVGISDLVLGQNHLNAIGALSTVSAVAALAGGGGGGGIGSGGGLFGGGLFWVIMIVIAFIIQGAIVGALTGLIIGILFGAARGALRGGAVAATVSLTSLDVRNTSRGQIVWQSAKTGMLQGAYSWRRCRSHPRNSHRHRVLPTPIASIAGRRSEHKWQLPGLGRRYGVNNPRRTVHYDSNRE